MLITEEITVAGTITLPAVTLNGSVVNLSDTKVQDDLQNLSSPLAQQLVDAFQPEVHFASLFPFCLKKAFLFVLPFLTQQLVDASSQRYTLHHFFPFCLKKAFLFVLPFLRYKLVSREVDHS